MVFYEIAKSFYDARASIGEEAMQDFVKEFGYSAATKVDLAGESAGRIPTPAWKKEYFKDVPEEAQWLPGDYSNMVIGQGYVLVTPIQVARAYAAVATGRLLRPHLLKEARNSLGDTVLSFDTVEDSKPDVTDANYKIIRDALHGVSTENSSISSALSGYSWTSASKTGTAEVAGKEDMAWFSMYAPYEDPQFALTVCVEEGGSGGTVGAPVAVQVMDAAIQSAAGSFEEEMTAISGTAVSGSASNQ